MYHLTKRNRQWDNTFIKYFSFFATTANAENNRIKDSNINILHRLTEGSRLRKPFLTLLDQVCAPVFFMQVKKNKHTFTLIYIPFKGSVKYIHGSDQVICNEPSFSLFSGSSRAGIHN
jgi:hypothetical protein